MNECKPAKFRERLFNNHNIEVKKENNNPRRKKKKGIKRENKSKWKIEIEKERKIGVLEARGKKAERYDWTIPRNST
jgi:hypothetical protein